MKTQKNYSGLFCPSIMPGKYKQLDQRPEVLEKTPEAYEEGLLEHPAIPGLMLTREQRLMWEALEIVNCDNDFLCRLESVQEKRFRIKWQKPIPMTKSSTEGDFVVMDTSLFKAQSSVPPKHFYPSDIEAHEKKVADEKVRLRLKKEADEAEAKEKEVPGEKTPLFTVVKNEADEAMAGLVKLRDLQKSALAARAIVEEAKRENTDSEKSHLRNLEWRLASVLSRLQSLIEDLETGTLFGELQILAGEDLEDEIEIVGNEIALLRRAIQVLKGKGRDL